MASVAGILLDVPQQFSLVSALQHLCVCIGTSLPEKGEFALMVVLMHLCHFGYSNSQLLLPTQTLLQNELLYELVEVCVLLLLVLACPWQKDTPPPIQELPRAWCRKSVLCKAYMSCIAGWQAAVPGFCALKAHVFFHFISSPLQLGLCLGLPIEIRKLYIMCPGMQGREVQLMSC